MFGVLLWLLLLTLPASAASPWSPSLPEVRAIAQLTARHAPACQQIIETLPAPAVSLAAIAEHVDQPAWVGIRAAKCLYETGSALPVLKRWAPQAKFRGLNLALWGRYNTDASEVIALKAAVLLLQDPPLRKLLLNSRHPAVRQLAQSAP